MYENDEGFEGVELNTPMGSFRAGRGGGWNRVADEADEDYRRAKRRVRR